MYNLDAVEKIIQGYNIWKFYYACACTHAVCTFNVIQLHHKLQPRDSYSNKLTRHSCNVYVQKYSNDIRT